MNFNSLSPKYLLIQNYVQFDLNIRPIKMDFILLDQYRQYSCGDISRQQYVKYISDTSMPQEQICELSEISFSAIVFTNFFNLCLLFFSNVL